MRYIVDAALCCAHGRCYAVAPEVYQAGPDGYNANTGTAVEVPREFKAAARFGAKACPESAILVIDGQGTL